jgi:MYXO-CTERM domain-containing protein
MTKSRSLAGLLVLFALSLPPRARAERLVSAFDPKLHVRPPTMKALDGHAAELVLDEDYLESAARYQAQHPQAVAADEQTIGALGEIIVVKGNTTDLLTTNGTGYALQRNGLQALATKVIASFGDSFQAITIWMTFEDQASMMAEAYEVPVKNEVEGLGNLRVMDQSSSYGSSGALRSVLNMKTIGLRTGDARTAWQTPLETWGQESAHRWLVFFLFRDARTGRISDAMLGRQCSHYNKYLDTQASVHDGFAWTDNQDGTFTWTETSRRYGDLDLYAMGLFAPDEVAPFFMIDGIPGYTYPTSCQSYQFTFRPPAKTIMGQRVDITIDDVIAANGERRVPTDERQDYWHEAEVVLTKPEESITDPRVVGLATRLEKARIYWEDWNREASRNRLVMCTKTSGDCGDPRSDVGKITFNAANKGPASGPLALDVEVVNGGGRAATGVKVQLDTQVGTVAKTDIKDLGTVDPGAMRTQSFPVDLKGVACGTEVTVKASTQSDFHHDRKTATFLLGAEEKISEGFEADGGWTTNPDGDDSTMGAQWERGTPESSSLLHADVQPGAAHGGAGAWVTGLTAVSTGMRATLVRVGKATLLSPYYETKGLQDPLLRYWVSFAGVKAGAGGLEPSDQSKLVVEARAADMDGKPGDWMPLDSLSNDIAPTWNQRSVPLPKDLLKKARFQLRFTAIDDNPDQGGVEAAIDDLAITSNIAACYQTAVTSMTGGGSSGCGCRVGSRAPAGGLAMVLVLAAAAIARRRRRL